MEKVRFRQYAALLSQYLKPQRMRVALLSIFIFSGIGLALINPQILRYFIDAAEAGAAKRDLIIAGVAFFAIGLFRQVSMLVSTYLGQDIGWRATNWMRGDLAHHCLQLDMSFHHEHTPGEMVERVDGDTAALSNFFSEFIVQVVGSLLLLGGILIVITLEDWRIGIALTSFVAVSIYVYNLTRNIAVSVYTAEREGYSRLFGFLEERLTGIEDLRTNGGIRLYDGSVLRCKSGCIRSDCKSTCDGRSPTNNQRRPFCVGDCADNGDGYLPVSDRGVHDRDRLPRHSLHGDAPRSVDHD